MKSYLAQGLKSSKKQTVMNKDIPSFERVKINKSGAREPAIMRKSIYNQPKKPSPQHLREFFDVKLDKYV